MGPVAIAGTGLIGTSLGLALRKAGVLVHGWDPDRSAVEKAVERQAFDQTFATLAEAVQQARIVVLAGPLQAIVSTLPVLGEQKLDAVVSDVASVKAPVVQARPPGMRLVAGHPMAGREQAGPEAATPALFRGSAWIVCTDGAAPADMAAVVQMVEATGAVPVKMTAAQHDQAVARVSHLPQILAAALVNQVSSDPMIAGLVSGSFRDLTRVAASEPGWWPEVLSANAEHVGGALDQLVATLTEMRQEMQSDPRALADRFAAAHQRRQEMAPPVVPVGVVLADKPGEIALVGKALQQSSVDVRDLQMRHALHGGGGVLTISVRPEEEGALRFALEDEGFTLE